MIHKECKDNEARKNSQRLLAIDEQDNRDCKKKNRQYTVLRLLDFFYEQRNRACGGNSASMNTAHASVRNIGVRGHPATTRAVLVEMLPNML